MLKSLNGRFIIWGGVIVYIFLSCTPIAKKSFNYSSELEALSRLDLLPEFRSNCIVEQYPVMTRLEEMTTVSMVPIPISGKKITSWLLQI